MPVEFHRILTFITEKNRKFKTGNKQKHCTRVSKILKKHKMYELHVQFVVLYKNGIIYIQNVCNLNVKK